VADRVGERLKEARQRAGLSLARLSEASGISKTYLVRLEGDADANPSVEILRRIGAVVGLTVADLLGQPSLTFNEDETELPASLRQFAREAQLTSAELRLLASIRWRQGEEPRTSSRWRYILDSLRASRALDSDAER